MPIMINNNHKCLIIEDEPTITSKNLHFLESIDLELNNKMDLFTPLEFENSITKKYLVTYKPNIESYNYNDRIKITVNSSSFSEL